MLYLNKYKKYCYGVDFFSCTAYDRGIVKGLYRIRDEQRKVVNDRSIIVRLFEYR